MTDSTFILMALGIRQERKLRKIIKRLEFLKKQYDFIKSLPNDHIDLNGQILKKIENSLIVFKNEYNIILNDTN